MKRLTAVVIAGALLAACGSDGSSDASEDDILKGRAPNVSVKPIGGANPAGALPALAGGVVAAPALPPAAKTGAVTAGDRFVFFAFGDSYGSGEGNPYTPGDYDRGNKEVWTGTPWTGIASTGDERCHRSDASGSAKAAGKVKSNNPTLEVVHKSFACSGAESRHILSEPYRGADENRYKGQSLLPSQIEQALKSGIAPTEVDAIYVSIGGNDAGFGDVVEECFVWNQSPCRDVGRTRVQQALGRLGSVSANIANVALKLRQNFPNAHIFFSGYPDPLSVKPTDPGDVNKDGICSRVDEVDGVRFKNDYLWKISTPDAVFIRETFLAPLNANIAQGVAASGLTNVWYVDEHYQNNSGFAGFCARSTTPITRFNQEALRLQGKDCDVLCTVTTNISKGGWHPSDAGYTAYGNAIYNSIMKSGVISSLTSPPATPSNPWPVALTSAGSISIGWDDYAVNETFYELMYSSTGSNGPTTVKLPANSNAHTINIGASGVVAFALRACVGGASSTSATCSNYSSLNVSNALPAEPPGAVTCTTSTYGQVPQGGCSVTFSVPTKNYFPASMFSYVEVRKGQTVIGSALMPPGGGQVFIKYQGEAVGSTANLMANAYICSIVDGGKCLKGPDSTLSLKVVKSDGRGQLPVITPNLRPSINAPVLPGVAPSPIAPPSLGGSLQCSAGKCSP